MADSQVTVGNRQLSAQALDMARREPGRRAPWLCVSVACGETKSLAAARECLTTIGLPEVRAEALCLLDQLVAGATP